MAKKAQYMIKTVNQYMRAYGGFSWPRKGPVVAPDWDPNQVCGGLHGLLNGEGDISLLSKSRDAVWLLCRIDGEIVDLDGKIKTNKCTVIAAGDRNKIVNKLKSLRPDAAVCYCTSVSGDYGTSVSGDYGTSQSGYYGTSVSGDYGMSQSGYYGTSQSGEHGTSQSGVCGKSTSGDYGTSKSCYRGTSISGVCGTSIVTCPAKAQTGVGGVIIAYTNHSVVVLRAGNEIEPNIMYSIDAKGVPTKL